VTIDNTGGDARDVTEDLAFDRYPRWSPDGKQIVFTSDRTGGYEIHIVNADGTGLRKVSFGSKGASFPLWSPDGGRILYREETGALSLIDIAQASEEQKPVTLPAYENPKVSFVPWDWSLDGDKVLGTFSGSPMKAGYYSFGESRYVPITDTSYFPAWFSDGRRILFAFNGAISAIDIQTKKIVDIAQIPEGEMMGLGVSRDGGLIYYVVVDEESDIWMMDASPEK
jgi:Tol biopolymer transport system component